MRKNIKNYTSGWTVNKSLGEIQKMLAKSGANKIMIDYEAGEPSGLSFMLDTPKGSVPVTLPARYMNVVMVMYGQLDVYADQLEQAKRTAWRNLHDWIDAQLALIETEMVKMEEVFLPYMTGIDGRTFFESIEDRGFMIEAKL